MVSETQSVTLLEPPDELESLECGRWLSRPSTDPVVTYLEAEHWSGTTTSPIWQAARLSHAVYLYRETGTQWAAVAKYYTVKTGRDALRHAEGERERLQQAAAVVSRATFYHASSALRIARNGWVSRLDRMGLVAQAMALLARLDD